jgi:hypothetical protein
MSAFEKDLWASHKLVKPVTLDKGIAGSL